MSDHDLTKFSEWIQQTPRPAAHATFTAGPARELADWVDIVVAREKNELFEEIKQLRSLVRRAMIDSTIPYINEIGCFYCEQSGRHTRLCPAYKLAGDDKP